MTRSPRSVTSGSSSTSAASSAISRAAGRSWSAAIELDHPRLSLIGLEDGSVNWDITKKTPEATPKAAAKPTSISLKRLKIGDAVVGFDDRNSAQGVRSGFNQTLTGDFSQTLVAIKTKADADTVSVTFAGIPYLNKVKLALTADVQADLAKKAYTLKETGLRLNDLTLAVAGSASTAGKNTNLDLAFSAPSTNFRSILSLVPAVYAHDFDKVKTTGSIRGERKGQRRVRRQRLSVVRAQGQGGQRRLPVSRPPAPRA